MDINYYRQYEPIFGEWRITRQLGEGSFGKVFAMEREDFGTRYEAALKAITVPASKAELEEVMADGMDETAVRTYYESFVQELVREFELMSHLKGNSNIVSYEDHKVIPHEGTIGWDILIRMELLTPLNQYARQHQITRQDVIRLGIDMCKALELCQKYNIIHRDVKPENIFISANGDFKLGDFGIARTIEKTTSGLSKKGTYTYMAPEVYKGQEYGSSVDIYSLGIVLYRLLNENRTPFLPAYPAPITHSDRENALARRFSGAALPPPAHADGRLAEIVLKACAYDPKERYQVPLRMREDLEAILYNREEGRVIYPEGDEVPQHSVQYVKTGEEEKLPEYEKTAGPGDAGGAGNADAAEDDRTVSDFGSPKGRKGGKAGRDDRGAGAGTGAGFGDDDRTVSDFRPGQHAGSQGSRKKKNHTGLIIGILAAVAVAGVGIFLVQKNAAEKKAAEAASIAAAESEAARLAAESEAAARAEAEARRQTAIDLYKAGSYQEALEAAETALADDPEDTTLIGIRADSLYMLEDFEAAAESYYTLSQREDYEWQVDGLRNYAVCLARAGEFDQAATVFVMLTNMGADPDVTSYVLGETYLAKGETENAIESFRTALNATKNDMIRERSIRSLAEIYRDNTMYQDSIQLLTNMADMTNPVYTEMLGEAYYQNYQDTGSQEAAHLGAEAFERTIRLGIQKEYLYTNAIWLRNLAGEPASAYDTLAEMERLWPNDHLPETLHAICIIYEQNAKPEGERDYSEAIRYHDQAAAKITVNDDTTYMQMLESIISELRRNGWIS